MSEWAPLLRDAIVDHYSDLGYTPEGRIGNPAVAGTFRNCGLEIHVDYGGQGGYGLYRTTDPWPTPINVTQRWTGSRGYGLAADYTIRVLDCVPGRDDAGMIPDTDTYTTSVDHITAIGQAFYDALAAAQQAWRTGTVGYMHFTGIEPLARQGVHAGWETSVTTEIC